MNMEVPHWSEWYFIKQECHWISAKFHNYHHAGQAIHTNVSESKCIGPENIYTPPNGRLLKILSGGGGVSEAKISKGRGAQV